MSTTLSRILTALVLLISTEAYQLAKVPGLIHHYSHHLLSKPEMTFSSFLAAHYEQVESSTASQLSQQSEPQTSNKTSDDDDLPFMHDDCEFSTELSVGMPVLVDVRLTLDPIRVAFEPPVHPLLPQTLGTDIFEPPRLA